MMSFVLVILLSSVMNLTWMLMVILQMIVLRAVMKMAPKPDLPVKFLHTSHWSIPLTNDLIRLVTTVMTLGLLIP